MSCEPRQRDCGKHVHSIIMGDGEHTHPDLDQRIADLEARLDKLSQLTGVIGKSK